MEFILLQLPYPKEATKVCVVLICHQANPVINTAYVDERQQARMWLKCGQRANFLHSERLARWVNLECFHSYWCTSAALTALKHFAKGSIPELLLPVHCESTITYFVA